MSCTFKGNMQILKKEEADTIRGKESLTLQNPKPPKDKALKEFQSDTSIVILPANNGSSTVILNHEDYLKMHGSYKQWSISIT